MERICNYYKNILQKLEKSFFLHRCEVTSYTEETTSWGEQRRIKKVLQQNIPCRLQYQPKKDWTENSLIPEQDTEAILMYSKDAEILQGDRVIVWIEGQQFFTFWAAGPPAMYLGHNEIGLCAVREG